MIFSRLLPPPQPSPAAGFALRGRASFCGISDFHPHNKHSAYTLAHRPLHSPTSARLSAALLPLPVGLKQLARSATSICSRSERKGWGEGSKKSSVASTIDLYRDHFTCPNTTEHTARNPTPALPHRGRGQNGGRLDNGCRIALSLFEEPAVPASTERRPLPVGQQATRAASFCPTHLHTPSPLPCM